MATKKKTKGNKVDKIKVRMYRVGTGDFFLLQFKKGSEVTFNAMFDCGCIYANIEDFRDKIADLKDQTNGIVDLLVVTHEHADHINGFQCASSLFDEIIFKRVWFAWTERKTGDTLAQDLRKYHSKVSTALTSASAQLTSLLEKKYFDSMYEEEHNRSFMMDGKSRFISSLGEVSGLNAKEKTGSNVIPTMEDILRDNKVIKDHTEVKFYDPGAKVEDLEGAEGIRFFILGPPRDNDMIGRKDKKGEAYEKRQKKSSVDFAFLDVLEQGDSGASVMTPFEDEYVLKDESLPMVKTYRESKDLWRTIDYDYLFSAGSLALKHEKSVNNTSLVVAIQFADSERVLLFTGDAEPSNWESWHKGLSWSIRKDDKTKRVNAQYLLNNTVFYKVGHHLSQNGTALANGLNMMNNPELAGMVALDLHKIMSGWRNTMPSDYLGAELIKRTGGKLLLLGDCDGIVRNIDTDRVTISETNHKNLEKLNKSFDGKIYMDYEVKG